MKTKRELKEDDSCKNKRRRRELSFITVFLGIFLLFTTLTIVKSNVKVKNPLEIIDSNWSVSLIMYDRSSSTPNVAITEATWSPTDEFDNKYLVMQINYACTTGKAYSPGDIVITIPGISRDDFSEKYRIPDFYYNSWLENNVVVAADKYEEGTTNYD